MKYVSYDTRQKFRFNKTFRDYQMRVLQNALIHLKDNRIHIVAAPGSGKTILGLELICRLGEPALVLSPTLSIRDQWKQRFAESFIGEHNLDDYVSTSLKDIKFITSITYQTLYSAFNRLKNRNTSSKSNNEEDMPADSNYDETDQDSTDSWDNINENEDYENFDILNEIKKAGIKTICLDEAHHLRAEWQRALETFLKKLGKGYKIIALTATPPYDSSKAEWDKYVSVCGEIDDEIFVPELVKAKNLCYHQDYIYFNYPGEDELNAIYEFDSKIDAFVADLASEGLLYRLANENLVFKDPDKYLDICFDDEEDFIGFLNLLNYSNEYIPPDIRSLFLNQRNNIVVDAGFQFIFDHKELFPSDLYDAIVSRLHDAKLIEKNKVRNIYDKKINKLMIQSIGKLESIRQICISEFNNMGHELRMLILGDYIRKNYLSDIGTNNAFTQIGIVPIFETVRRSLGTRAKIGVLTGSLVILPEATLNEISSIAEKNRVSFNCRPLVDGYVVIENINKSNVMVKIITGAFQMGLIEILIGTKSLLGEGWDSPNINSLILASFVGSYVLSNQMRGRAIRTDPTNEDKTANIWHLVTVEPANLFKNRFSMASTKHLGDAVYNSSDFLTLERRFKTFVGPHFTRDIIENGIKRISIITPPFNKAGIDRINKMMLSLANDREGMKRKWLRALGEDCHGTTKPCYGVKPYEMQKQTEIKRNVKPEVVFINHLYSILVTIGIALYWILFRLTFSPGMMLKYSFALFPGFIAYNFLFLSLVKSKMFISRITSPKKRLKIQSEAILKTYIHMGLIRSKGVRVKVETEGSEDSITISLAGGTAREKEIFAAALREMTAPIKKQKYLLVYKSKSRIKLISLATPCPDLIAQKREYVDYLKKQFQSRMIPYDVVYTRNMEGRQILLNARKLSLKNIDTALSECVERFVSI
ncbi:MAG: DEAD/DEAH box helicase family protein [Clostridiaceae bacterium]|nr:DEAD/DEAH box helicase family protein [Clostridiaceae bacterium]